MGEISKLQREPPIRGWHASFLNRLLKLALEESGRFDSPEMPTPLIIGITGGSGAGKSTLASKIAGHFGTATAAVIEQDWYYKDLSHLAPEEAAQTNFDHPDALDLGLLAQHLTDLKGGLEITAPQYDFATFSRLESTVSLSSKPLIIVDGLFLLTDRALRKLLDLSVFVEVPSDIRLARRIRRDLAERGYPLQSILESWETRARPMFERFVAPQRKQATYLWKSLEDKAFVTHFLADLVNRLAINGHRPTSR